MKILSNAEYQRKVLVIEEQGNTIDMLQRELASIRVREIKVVEKVRIEQNVFDALAKELPKPCVPKSELEAGVLLGVQMVLERIRQGWVV